MFCIGYANGSGTTLNVRSKTVDFHVNGEMNDDGWVLVDVR